MTAEELYALELDETLTTPLYHITRVPNGWLYKDRRGAGGAATGSSVFVQMNDEFKPKAETKTKKEEK